jgi:tryptophanyl-tRNA synthetase
VRIFSGIQPTGRKHLGNYIGAIAQYVSSQDRGEGIFCIVDLHALTVPYDPVELRERLYDTTAILLAAGLDPARCILFRQSDVREHTELTWLLSSVTELGRLERMHQFRDKSEAQRQMVRAGLLFYPVLQPALRRRRAGARRARAADARGGRADHGSAGPRAEDVDDGRL